MDNTNQHKPRGIIWTILTALVVEAAMAIPLAFVFAWTSIWQETGRSAVNLSLILGYYQGHQTVDILVVVGLCIVFAFVVVAPRESD